MRQMKNSTTKITKEIEKILPFTFSLQSSTFYLFSHLYLAQNASAMRPVMQARVSPADKPNRIHVRRSGKDGARDGYGQHGVVGESAPRVKQGKRLGLDRSVLVNRSDDVACDGTDHERCLLQPSIFLRRNAANQPRGLLPSP
jgi:hypothetical protein